MSIYDNNLAVIKEKDRCLYSFITEDEDVFDDLDCHHDTAKNGTSILYVNKNDERIYLNSRYNPERESDGFIKKYQEIKDYSLMVFFGLGNGMIAERLINTLPEHVRFIFYEPSVSLFVSAISYFDLTKVFRCDRVTVVVNGCRGDRIDLVMAKNISADNYRLSNYNVMPLYKQIFENEESIFHQQFDFHVFTQLANIDTVMLFGKKIAYNDIYNMRKIFDCNCEEDFENKFPVDRPVIIVSAGPSLEKNVEVLKKAKGYYLIIAVDTALPFLISSGVRPDIVFIVDACKPKVLFEDEKCRDIILAISTEANYEATETIDGKVIYISSESSYYNKLFGLKGRKLFQLSGGGSVSTLAFAQAIAWGFKKIVLVGQDLACDPDKIHAGNVDSSVLLGKDDKDILVVDGYYGDKVYTYSDYNYFRRWFEVVIEGDRDIEVINATEGGAKIKGTIQMPLIEVIEKYKKDYYDFEKMIMDCPPVFSKKDYSDIVKIWSESIENLRTIKKLFSEGIDLIKTGVSIIDRATVDRIELNRIKKKLSDIINQCDKHEEIYFLDAMVSGEEADILGDIYLSEDDKLDEVKRMFEKLERYMNLMYSNVDEVIDMFESNIMYAKEQFVK